MRPRPHGGGRRARPRWKTGSLPSGHVHATGRSIPHSPSDRGEVAGLLFAAYSLGEWQPPWLLNEQVSGEGSPSHNLHPRPEESVCLRVVRSPSASSGGHLRVTHLGLLVLVLSRRALHGLVGALPFVHPQLRLLHDGSQLVQVLFDLFVVVDVLAGNKQLNLNNECNSSVAWRRHHHIHACMHTRVYTRTRGNLTYLLEGLQHLLPLAEVPEKQLQGPRHQRGVVVHRQVQQDAEEGSAAVVIQVQGGVLLAKAAQRGGGQMSHKRPPCRTPWAQAHPTGHMASTPVHLV